MRNRTKFIAAAGIVAASIAADHTFAQSQKMEKCFNIVKAGQNDCANATGTHSCATLAKKDSEPAEWLLLPEGTCDKIVGGKLEKVEEKSMSPKN